MAAVDATGPGWRMLGRLARILLVEHQADDTGRCRVCRDEPAPCPTAELAGVGLGEAYGLSTPRRRALRTVVGRRLVRGR